MCEQCYAGVEDEEPYFTWGCVTYDQRRESATEGPGRRDGAMGDDGAFRLGSDTNCL